MARETVEVSELGEAGLFEGAIFQKNCVMKFCIVLKEGVAKMCTVQESCIGKIGSAPYYDTSKVALHQSGAGEVDGDSGPVVL